MTDAAAIHDGTLETLEFCDPIGQALPARSGSNDSSMGGGLTGKLIDHLSSTIRSKRRRVARPNLSGHK
jgi:hypothetical protein